jgi:hypothetical protein
MDMSFADKYRGNSDLDFSIQQHAHLLSFAALSAGGTPSKGRLMNNPG